VTETRLHRASHVVVGASRWYYGDYPWGLAKDSLLASLLLLLIGNSSALGLIALGVGLFVVRPAPPAGASVKGLACQRLVTFSRSGAGRWFV